MNCKSMVYVIQIQLHKYRPSYRQEGSDFLSVNVLNVIELEQPKGVIVQFGGQTAINLAAGLEANALIKVLRWIYCHRIA